MGNLHEDILSPSSSERWLKCPMSAVYAREFRLLDSKDELGSRTRIEGTIAHMIAADILGKRLEGNVWQIKDFGRFVIEKNIKITPEEVGEMNMHGNEYAEKVFQKYLKMKEDGSWCILQIEKTVDCSAYAINCVGTPDAFIVTKDRIVVFDYKYGKKVPVSAENNSQLKIYSLAIYDTYKELIDESGEVELQVIQPRNGGVKTWTIPIPELKEWGHNTLRLAAIRIEVGCRDANVGDWCKYCSGKDYCIPYNAHLIQKSKELERKISYIEEMTKVMIRVKNFGEEFAKKPVCSMSDSIQGANVIMVKSKSMVEEHLKQIKYTALKSLSIEISGRKCLVVDKEAFETYERFVTQISEYISELDKIQKYCEDIIIRINSICVDKSKTK